MALTPVEAAAVRARAECVDRMVEEQAVYIEEDSDGRVSWVRLT